MRSFYLLIVAIAVLLPLSLISKPIGTPLEANQNLFHSVDEISKQGIKFEDVISVKVKDAPAPQMAFKVLTDDQDYFWSAISEGVTPFSYEPKSNTLIYVTTDRVRDGEWVKANVYLHFSQDNGQSWSKINVFSKPESMAMFPSVAVLNPKNSTDPEEFKIVVSYSYYKPDPTPVDTFYRPAGNYYLYFNGEDGWDGVLEYDELGPNKNNPGGTQQWSWQHRRMLAVSSPKGDHFYVYGYLMAEENYQNGYYGIAYIDFTESDADPNSQIPPQWDLSLFRPSESLNNYTVAPLRLSADEEGNVYAFMYNIFNDGTTNRIPMFSKSTDNGSTWSELDAMPLARFDDFLANWGHNPTYGYTTAYPFNAWDAIVTGVDEFSMFVRYLSFVGTNNNDAVGTTHILEVKYKNGNWQPINRIAEYFIDPIRIFNIGEFAPKDTAMFSPRCNEIEAAKTADGKSIVLKFIDHDPSVGTAVLENKATLVGDPFAVIDSIFASDIFLAYRNIDNDNWTINNVTKDKWYNRGTFMPNIVPSISQVPVAEYVSGEITDTDNPRFAYPYFLVNILQDRDGLLPSPPRNTLLVSTFDFNNPTPINNPSIQNPKGLVGTSVLETLPFALNDVAPNPANDATTLSFNLDYNAEVVVNIHNAMGQIVKNVYNGYANSGMNTINILTNDLPAGAYFYTINVDGKSQTKLLNVVR